MQSSMLSESEKRYLLQVARNSITSALGDLPLPKMSPCPPALLRPSGAFVTLHEKGELRGCIGYTEGVQPLVRTVAEVAVKSAREDPRFATVAVAELPDIEIEISVISPMKLIDDVEEIEVGTHGLLLEWRGNRGLLLPQVPVEYGWDREMFLSQTSRKAGLPQHGWKFPETKLFIFTAEVFSERSLKHSR